jgi:hypothetical protein
MVSKGFILCALIYNIKYEIQAESRNLFQILRWIFRKWEGVVGTGWSGLRIGTGGGHFWVW